MAKFVFGGCAAPAIGSIITCGFVGGCCAVAAERPAVAPACACAGDGCPNLVSVTLEGGASLGGSAAASAVLGAPASGSLPEAPGTLSDFVSRFALGGDLSAAVAAGLSLDPEAMALALAPRAFEEAELGSTPDSILRAADSALRVLTAGSTGLSRLAPERADGGSAAALLLGLAADFSLAERLGAGFGAEAFLAAGAAFGVALGLGAGKDCVDCGVEPGVRPREGGVRALPRPAPFPRPAAAGLGPEDNTREASLEAASAASASC